MGKLPDIYLKLNKQREKLKVRSKVELHETIT